MKNKKIFFIVFFTFFVITTLTAQSQLFLQAMNTEIKRSMDSLRIENMQSPHFISYRVTNARLLQIRASLGAIIESDENQYCSFSNRIQVGENGKTNENFIDFSNLYNYNYYDNKVPVKGNEIDIRRAFWMTTDANYKKAVTTYEAKMASLDKQSFSEEELQLSDFSPTEKNMVLIPYKPLTYQKSALEQQLKNISAVFLNYPQIMRSEVSIAIFDAEITFANSEGTNVSYPLQVVFLRVFVKSQFPGGEEAKDHQLWVSNSIAGIPDEKTIVAEYNKLGHNLTSLLNAPAVSESYSGPVLFEDQAAAEIFAQLFFENTNGLNAIRKPIAGSQDIISYEPDRFKENELEQMMFKKIISRDLTIEAPSTMSSYNGIPLVGSYQVDAEGVKCSDTLTLVKNGVLTNLLNDRTPTLKMGKSNGHCRTGISSNSINACSGPGVVILKNSNPATTADKAQLKQKLMAAAKEEDLEYAYIVRKIVSRAADVPEEGLRISFSGGATTWKLTETISVYRVRVSDGSEELVSLAEIQGLSVRSFKRIIATSSNMQVYNTLVFPANSPMYGSPGSIKGIPASLILPDAILFEEIDIVRAKQDMVRQLPVVSNPVSNN